MSNNILSRRDIDFILFELLECETLTTRPRFADHSRETFGAGLDTAFNIATDHFAPHQRKADENEPTFDGKTVTMIPEVKAALTHFNDAGFIASTHDYEVGGMQLPFCVSQACGGVFHAANVATASYPFLTTAAANVIRKFGTPAQQDTYLEAMLTGRYYGTMALTEPQAGSSLSDIKTAATPADDGSYRISGNKIFISAGDHELSENIVHLVLAKIKGAPAGVKGISLFIVPKFLVNDDGSLGPRNDVALAGLIHKMGYRGTTSTMLNFGENGECVGYLVGEPHRGLSYMFQMMNEARIGVGHGAVMLGYSGYLHALDYARNRPQGRHPQDKNPTTAQVPIIEHTDVKRMLLAQKAYVEGGLALTLYSARLVDEAETGDTDDARQGAALLLDILTPMVKAWPSHYCLEASSLAIQVHGGYGYTREYPVEQLYRDNRLNPIHEGTNGIQGLDLLGRKVPMHNGAAYKLLLKAMTLTADEAAALDELAGLAAQLSTAIADIAATTDALLAIAARGETNVFLANASLYLDMMGHTVVAWLWLRQAIVAAKAQGSAQGDDANFYAGKIHTARFFFAWELPKVAVNGEILRSEDTTCLDMRDEFFG